MSRYTVHKVYVGFTIYIMKVYFSRVVHKQEFLHHTISEFKNVCPLAYLAIFVHNEGK